ncbi:hypothetical protein [Candidatus Uabimicrobium amorphum]|uniref:Uncharacterized protein n=1 Tax=Uabimicrobium amorphum TaxID=2596890 RepID=A0A5S9F434_UABAM|nr:hypothetical protein [Candidatus Uabimicrobium amorphum]BBM84159.1 hypothetical protein UABAM_02515 [Candidatus Uabimicrobium amorphum]
MNNHNTKLFTTKSWVIAISAIITGASISLVREYYNTNVITTQSIIISLITLVIGLIIIAGVAWWANKPEEES